MHIREREKRQIKHDGQQESSHVKHHTPTVGHFPTLYTYTVSGSYRHEAGFHTFGTKDPLSGGGTGGWGVGTHVLHVGILEPLTTRPREDGDLFSSQHFSMTNIITPLHPCRGYTAEADQHTGEDGGQTIPNTWCSYPKGFKG